MNAFGIGFAVFGVIVAIIICAVVVVWLTCFCVKMLTRTFSTTLDSFSTVQKEDIKLKYEAKRERMLKARELKSKHQAEEQEKKLNSKQKVHEYKMTCLDKKLAEQEDKARVKYDIEPTAEEREFIEKIRAEKENKREAKIKEHEEKAVKAPSIKEKKEKKNENRVIENPTIENMEGDIENHDRVDKDEE